VARVTNLNRLIDELKRNNIWTIGVEADAKKDYTSWDWTQPSALIFGGEGKGLHRLVRENCDEVVRIPLRGHISSLNVSVAVGILLYEALRQRVITKAP
jgi:23S rRNA (guanosine2251-2'-O)-methyltransferase